MHSPNTPEAQTASTGGVTPAATPEGPPLAKLLLEVLPLVVFFVVNARAGIFWGTGCFMVATVLSLIVSRAVLGRIPIMPLVSGAFILVFGGLTLVLHDEMFIKLKPTIVNLLFASILFGGLYFGHSLLKHLFGDVFRLTDEGWRVLTMRWASFFVALAVLNEIVWRMFSSDVWISFKLLGILPLTMIFAVAQIGLLKQYEVRD